MVSKILGESNVIRELKSRILKVAPTNVRVLILGPSGTGKELIAEAIHENSPRSSKPFIRLNCASVPSELIESELFGHEKGAFTGASERRLGRFEQADTGTLFLDEIGDMPLSMQSKLLRILQEGTFERIGGKTTIKVDVRVISATHRDLRSEITERRFREDLYHRISTFPLISPRLVEHLEDLPCLLRSLGVLEVSRAILAILEDRPWHGNIRELQNVIERAKLLGDGVITVASIREAISMDSIYSSQVDKAVKPKDFAPFIPESVIIPGLIAHKDGRRGIVEETDDTAYLVLECDLHGLPKLPATKDIWSKEDIEETRI